MDHEENTVEDPAVEAQNQSSRMEIKNTEGEEWVDIRHLDLPVFPGD